MLSFLRYRSLLIASMAILVTASAAFTAPINNVGVGDSISLTFNGNIEGANVAQLGASAMFTLVSIDAAGDTATFSVSLSNTSSYDSRITALGFDINPNATDGNVTGAVIDSILFNKNLPNGVGIVEVCLTTGNCTGGGSAGDGVADGDSTSFQFTLNFGTNLTADSEFSFDNFAVRYQAITGGSYDDASGTGRGTGTLIPGGDVDPQIPEPSTYMMMGGGMLGLALLRFRRR